MDISIISTYRCNSHCSMCNVWRNPTLPKEEVNLDTLKKVPTGVDNLNITGGEPTLRNDLFEMVEILYPKARKLEISSNGLHPERLEPIIRKYPNVKIRFSLDGYDQVNNRIRGEENGFAIKLNGLKRLKELGGCDLGFAITIQDDNIDDLLKIYKMTQEMGVELATSTLHNGFQFHKSNNYPYNRKRVAQEIEKLITEMLKTNSVKTWFRGYLNLGLIEKVLGHNRLIPCTAATDFIFVDPWGDLYACNVRQDLKIGNLIQQNWEEAYHSERAIEVRKQVATCQQNCWMVGSARTAMRNSQFTQFPKVKPFLWVINQKLKVTLGHPINFCRYIDYDHVEQRFPGEKREFYLDIKDMKRSIQTRDQNNYDANGPYNNR